VATGCCFPCQKVLDGAGSTKKGRKTPETITAELYGGRDTSQKMYGSTSCQADMYKHYISLHIIIIRYNQMRSHENPVTHGFVKPAHRSEVCRHTEGRGRAAALRDGRLGEASLGEAAGGWNTLYRYLSHTHTPHIICKYIYIYTNVYKYSIYDSHTHIYIYMYIVISCHISCAYVNK